MANKNKDDNQTNPNIHPDLIEIPGFRAVRIELIQLLKYWYKQRRDWDLWYLQTGAVEPKECYRCAVRQNKICEFLSKEDVDKTYQEAKEEYENDIKQYFLDESDWDVYCHGSKEQREELHTRFEKARLEAYELEAAANKPPNDPQAK